MSNDEMWDVSVVICTRNRADSLQNTLQSLRNVTVPEAWNVELLLINNDSSDHTCEVIRNTDVPLFDIRVVDETRAGLSHARNTAVQQARGEILLFTDDDVRLPSDWIVGMTEPIREGRAEAVAGGVELAPHLQREWQEEHPWLTSPLATTHVLSTKEPKRMVGANMAIARHVFESVPRFDPELDPGGRLGLGGETLMSRQIKDAGYRLVSALDVKVEHHCAPDRLSRERYLEFAIKVGRSQGYIDYHWEHRPVRPLRLLLWLCWDYLKLMVGYVVKYQDTRRPEGLPGWEMSLLTQIYHRRQLLDEWGRPRKYARS